MQLTLFPTAVLSPPTFDTTTSASALYTPDFAGWLRGTSERLRFTPGPHTISRLSQSSWFHRRSHRTTSHARICFLFLVAPKTCAKFQSDGTPVLKILQVQSMARLQDCFRSRSGIEGVSSPAAHRGFSLLLRVAHQ